MFPKSFMSQSSSAMARPARCFFAELNAYFKLAALLHSCGGRCSLCSSVSFGDPTPDQCACEHRENVPCVHSQLCTGLCFKQAESIPTVISLLRLLVNAASAWFHSAVKVCNFEAL